MLPYMKEPATGSLIPSISTGGAAMKATMKHAAAASKHGIMSTPNNQHKFCCQLRLPIHKTLAILLGVHQICVELKELSLVRRLNRASGKMRYLFPVIPHYWIERRSIILPIGLGLRAVYSQGYDNFESVLNGEEILTCIYYISFC